MKIPWDMLQFTQVQDNFTKNKEKAAEEEAFLKIVS